MHVSPNGCTKCVINDGFVAIIARLLARTVGDGHQLYAPSRALADAADAATEVFEYAFKRDLRSAPDKHEFVGCAEATKLMQYVTEATADAKSLKTDAMMAEIKRIHGVILGHIGDLVSNKDIPSAS